jgi:hypothetical protein
MTTKAEELFRQAFGKARQARSLEYRHGVRAALAYRLEGRPSPQPYPLGTARADAWFAGLDEGHALWRQSEDTL